jgi:hypothetical protein
MNVSDLEKNGYQLKEKFLYSELTAFIKEYLSKTNAATVTFLVVNIAFLLLLSFQVGWAIIAKTDRALSLFSFFSGFIVLILVIPVHELIHAIAYKLAGAKKVSFDINFKKFTVLTVADRFVANKTQFIKILLAPFIVISTTLIVVYLIGNVYTQCAVTSVLVLHTLMCSGDFGLTSYFLFHKDRTVVTFDDNTEKASYFFEQNQ